GQHGIEDIAHHLLEVVRPLHGSVDPVHAFQEPDPRLALLLGSLAVFDIGCRDIPAQDASLLVAQRTIAEQEPSIRSILSTHACFEFVRNVACGSRINIFRYTFPVIRMIKPETIGDAPPFLRRYAEVIERGLVGIETLPRRPKHCYQLRREIQDLPQLYLLLLDSLIGALALFFGPLAFGDVAHQGQTAAVLSIT